jgi:hypothetical protein
VDVVIDCVETARAKARRLGTPKAFATWAWCATHNDKEERTAVLNLMAQEVKVW